MTIERSVPKLHILTCCGCLPSARGSMTGIWQVSNQDWTTSTAAANC